MKQAIQYCAKLDRPLSPEELESSAFLTYIHIVQVIERERPNLRSLFDWMKLNDSLKKYFAFALRHKEENRCLYSGLNLIQAWIYSNLARLDKDSSTYGSEVNKYFDRAKKYEAKENLENPISGGKVHFLLAQVSWANSDDSDPVKVKQLMRETTDDMLIAVEKGFDYAKFIFSDPMKKFSLAVIKQKKHDSKLIMPQSLADVPFDELVTDAYVYDRALQNNDNLELEYRSATLARYVFAMMLMERQQFDLAALALKFIIYKGERSSLCAIQPQDDNETQEIKLFWQELLLQDYSAFISKLFDAFARYQRVSENKRARVALRNEMLALAVEIDSKGKSTTDKVKVDTLKERLLPLIVRFSSTDLSTKQILGMKFTRSNVMPNSAAAVAANLSLSKLTLETLEAFVETFGLNQDDIRQISSERLAQIQSEGSFDEGLSRSVIEREVTLAQSKYAKRFKVRQPLLTLCKPAYVKLNNEDMYTPSHPLLSLVKLELILSHAQAGASFSELVSRIDIICEESLRESLLPDSYDYSVALFAIMKNQVDAKSKKSLFEMLLENGSLGESVSLFSFDSCQLARSANDENGNKAVISYLIALQLFSKQRYELGTYYLAQAYYFGNQGSLFRDMDNGFCQSLFYEKNWSTFYALITRCLQSYAEERLDASMKQRRIDYTNKILLDIKSIEESKESDCVKIQQFKNNILPMLLFLSGLDLGSQQKVALRISTLKKSNLCKATKIGLNIAIQLLGLTKDDFKNAKEACLKKATDNEDNLKLGLNASELYFDDIVDNIDNYNLKQHSYALISACRPFLAVSRGNFPREQSGVSQEAMYFFLGVKPQKASKAVAQSSSSLTSDQNNIAKSTIKLNELNINEAPVNHSIQEESEHDIFVDNFDDDEPSEVFVPKTVFQAEGMDKAIAIRYEYRNSVDITTIMQQRSSHAADTVLTVGEQRLASLGAMNH